MKLYNSLSQKIEDVEPINNRHFRIYSCGPTVYNNLHIGNLSSFIYADLLVRTLRASGNEVKHVMNLTDVDDKTIRDSKIQYPELEPHQALKKLTDKYSEVFFEDLKKTGNNTQEIEFISAVDSINEMLALIQKIIDNGFAYVSDDGIYFSVKSYIDGGNKYGLLQKIDLSMSQSRINNDEYDKDSATDFALWKLALPEEPFWDASFTIDNKEVKMQGRPGWHIECSAMSQSALGAPFDIHTGGIDLKFPHHENEIAQTCASGAHKLCNYFVHNNHILVDSRKMSKSLGNFYTLRDIEQQGFSAEAFRLLVLSSHYQNESNFTWEILEASKNLLNSWQSYADRIWQLDERPYDKNIQEAILNTISDNLNTPEVIAQINKYFGSLSDNQAPSKKILEFIDSLLGTKLVGDDINNDQKELIASREEARAEKDFDKSDSIRDELLGQNIEIKDTPYGSIWSRI